MIFLSVPSASHPTPGPGGLFIPRPDTRAERGAPAMLLEPIPASRFTRNGDELHRQALDWPVAVHKAPEAASESLATAIDGGI